MPPEAPISSSADGRDAARIFALIMAGLFVMIMLLNAVTS
jgi:hypothetical protein